MPIVDISGLTSEEELSKLSIRKALESYFEKKFGFPKDSTTVTFISDDTIGSEEHIMARLYSKKFTEMNVPSLEDMCDDVIYILEEIASHPFNEVIITSAIVIHGKNCKKRKSEPNFLS